MITDIVSLSFIWDLNLAWRVNKFSAYFCIVSAKIEKKSLIVSYVFKENILINIIHYFGHSKRFRCGVLYT